MAQFSGGRSHHKRIPLLRQSYRCNGILFIGFNPSYDKKKLEKYAKQLKYNKLTLSRIFRLQDLTVKTLNTAIAIEEIARAEHQYFQKSKNLAEICGLPWEHIDLFQLRMTNEKMTLGHLTKKCILTSFAKEQLRVTVELIDNINPKIIAVLSANGRKIFFGEISGFPDFQERRSEFDNDHGFHWYTIGQRKVPLFFSGMLSGGRALDTGSYERLRWHLRKTSKSL